jgi:hypothetical protein
MTTRRYLVVGSYPPVPGSAATATLTAVRRTWSAGGEVVVASPRPSAAPFVLRATGGRAVGRQLVRLGRQHGCDDVVLGLEAGWPVLRSEPEVRALAGALSSFVTAELLVSGELEVPWERLASLWAAARVVTVGAEDLVGPLREAGAREVRYCRPGPGSLASVPGAVGPVEPGDLLLAVRARRALGAAARRLLGPRAPAVRAQMVRVVAIVKRVISRRR